jgi:hypothetical protein
MLRDRNASGEGWMMDDRLQHLRYKILLAERDSLQAELSLRKKSGSASERLHNLCEGISKDADGSEWSREEWHRLDAENASLRAQLAEWEKLRDPVFLHANLLRGLPAKLDRDTFLHLAGEGAQLAARDRDAERYRYLRNRIPNDVLLTVGEAAGCWIDCEVGDVLTLLTGDEADAAIDAAMATPPASA